MKRIDFRLSLRGGRFAAINKLKLAAKVRHLAVD
jgi:hypothetical protein